MADKPIIFSAPMIQALLEGRKTQTRRVLKPQPPSVKAVRNLAGIDYQWFSAEQGCRPVGPIWAIRQLAGDKAARPIPYAPGDRLWVREKWSGNHAYRNEPPSTRTSFVGDGVPFFHDEIWYWADGSPEYGDWEKPRSPIHMPRWASRLTLTVTDVRVHRLIDTSNEDARSEGAPFWWRGLPEDQRAPTTTAVGMFRDLWNSIHGPDAWAANPWVVAMTFDVYRRNIDSMGQA